jgi:hypothetical protein
MYNIKFKRFAEGQEFTDILTEFIEDEIKNYGVKDKGESELTYLQFTDSVWFKSVNPDWIPYLVENNLLNNEQKNYIEGKIAKWKAIVAPSNLAWVYIILAVAVINAVIFIIVKRRKNKKKQPTSVMDDTV